MKKVTIFAASAAMVALASCSQEDVLSNGVGTPDGKAAISFNHYSVINQTKGTSVEGTDGFNTRFATDGFGVIAFSDKDAFDGPWIGNYNATGSTAVQIIGNNGGSATAGWYYNNPEDMNYWPDAEGGAKTLDFLAYAPYTGFAGTATATKASGLSVVDYTVPLTQAEQDDFMFASLNNQAESNATAGTGAANASQKHITLNFQHALTQVRFLGSVKSEKVHVKVSDITIHNLANVGDFTVVTESSTAVTTDNDDNADTDNFQNAAGTWSNIHNVTTATNIFTTAATTTQYPVTFGGNVGAASAVYLAGAKTGVTGADASNGDQENAIILLPQQIKPWATTKAIADNDALKDGSIGAYLKITGTIWVYDPADVAAGGSSDNWTKEYLLGSDVKDGVAYVPFHDGVAGVENTGTVATAANSLWLPNNRVTYNLIFDGGFDPTGQENFYEITFDATAQPWDDVTGGNVSM